MRFEVSYYALKPDVTVIAPWREWEFTGRPDLIAYAKKHNIEIGMGKENDAPFSIDANLLHTSSEGLVLEDPDIAVPDIVSKRADRRTITPEEAPDVATIITMGFERGDPVSINGKALGPADLLTELNRIGSINGVGGLDLVENRFVGMKSRGYYETPGGTMLLTAHRAMESITLDRGALHLKDELMPKYATIIYNGMWFTPERKMLQAAIDASQDDVCGEVTLKIYKGGVYVQGRSSPMSLYSKELISFDAAGGYNQKDAEGFIKLNALRLRIMGWRDQRAGKNG